MFCNQLLILMKIIDLSITGTGSFEAGTGEAGERQGIYADEGEGTEREQTDPE